MKYVAALALALCGCGRSPACESAEENLPKCGQEYYGDDNCELLIEDCTSDDEVILDAMFQCFAKHCDDPSACDNHFNRLTKDCQRSSTGN